MNIIVCDDSLDELQSICEKLEAYFKKHTESSFSIYRFSSPYSMIEYSKEHRIDIYLLDVFMPGINGIEVGKVIREKDEEAPIVYITSSSEFAVQSYSVHAADYLLKPVTEEAIFCMMDHVIKTYKEKFYKHWHMKVKSGFYATSYHNIIYIEYRNHRLTCYLTDGSSVESNTMRIPFDEAVAELKADQRFLKTGASFLVNMNHILRVTANEFVMNNGSSLKITRKYREARKKYIDFLLG